MKQNRFYILILFVSMLLAYQTTTAQENHLYKEISLNVKNMKLSEALYRISLIGKFHFSYNAEVIDGDRLVSFESKNKTVKTILDEIIESDVIYKVVGSHIVILQNKKEEKVEKEKRKVEYVISGYIIDSSTGKKISSATIYDVNGNCSAITDEAGHYTLRFPANVDAQGLNYCKKGYLDTVIIIKPQVAQEVDIYLSPKQEPISDIDTVEVLEEKEDITERPLVAAMVPKEAVVTQENLTLFETRKFQLSLVPFVGTSRMISGSVDNKLSINLFAGYSGGLKGVEVGGFANIVQNDVDGVQVAGFGNIVGGNTSGTQFAGFFNFNAGSLKGVQLAGFNNTVLNDVDGFQIAGFNNTLKGKMKGVQASGFNNVVTQDVDGIQAAGFSNVSLKTVNKSQISGFCNYSRSVRGAQITGFANVSLDTVFGTQICGFNNYTKNLKGLQFSAFSNVASESSTGVQIAPFFNYTSYLEGTQIALFNYADSVAPGATPIGLFTHINTGLHKFEISANDVTYANLSYKTGTKRFYNIFQAGTDGYDYYSAGYGVGTKFSFGEKMGLSIDLTADAVFETFKNFSFLGGIAKFNPSLDFKISDKFVITAGPTLNLLLTEAPTVTPSNGSLSTILFSPFYDEIDGNVRMQMWVGGKIGVRLFK